MSQNKQARSRLSYAQERPELIKGNPFDSKAANLTHSFEQERCPLNARQLAGSASNDDHFQERDAFKAMRRGQAQGSEMVQNHNPHPELKPSPELSGDIKDASHMAALEEEQKRASQQNKINEGKAIRNELLDYIDSLKEAAQTAEEITRPAPDKKLEDVEREGFKLLRRMQAQGEQVLSKSQAFRHSVGG